MGYTTTNQMMKNRLVFATNNVYKTREVREILAPQYEVINLLDLGCDVDIPETGNTFAENATLKSAFVVKNYQIDCFADDSGLSVEALNGEPGIFSARYSGQRGDVLNMNYLLEKMDGIVNRRAHFTTVISLFINDRNHLFEGRVDGKIRTAPIGENGFGYDPVFEPTGFDITFAEMDTATKNKISHRALAMKKLISFLKST